MKFELIQALRKLKRDLDTGTINADEYAVQRQALLDRVEAAMESEGPSDHDQTLSELLETHETTTHEFIDDGATAMDLLQDENTVSELLEEQNTGMHLLEVTENEDFAVEDHPEDLLRPQVTEEVEIPTAAPSRKGLLIPAVIGLALLAAFLFWRL